MTRTDLALLAPRSSSSPLRTSRSRAACLALLLAGGAAAVGCDSSSTPDPRNPGQTDFETEQPGGGLGNKGEVAFPTTAGGSRDAAGTPPPSGRTGPVEEADIYRIDQNRLFYLNTYRGFLIYDLNDPKNPKAISRLPVYGYPVEMFVQGNTVYALLQDVLYMSQVDGKVQFKRHNVSQLIAIDITDIAHPTVLQTIDIIGKLREGVARKIENTIYVVSQIPQAYYWGWRYELPTNPQQEQAWVYSFNVADPRNLRLVEKLKLFEGGSISDQDPVTGGSVTRNFNGVTLSATSNALMVAENWSLSSWTPGTTKGNGDYTCGAYAGDQRAVVSVVDISDPAGAIRLHARFQTRGSLGDQFKQTYVYDEAAKTATYYGIFARQAWVSTDCAGQSFVQNSFQSWDVTNGATPARLSSLDFGKPNETVRGSTFDVTRKAAFAITALNIDPLYVLSFADRNKLAIRSAIDGLSGDMTLFRLVEGNNFLVGIGRDASETCSGFQGSETTRGIGMAVSLIDVRNLDAIKLVQRQCVAVDADWVSSEISWNLDQAHKMIGMQSDGTTNVITVPVSYSKRSNDTSNGWWWYQWETAVGIMSWDVTKYDPAKAPAEQKVIQNFGTYIHPNGEVRRSIVFTHQQATPRRMMVNLSDTHVSIADIQDLAHPAPQAIVEIAPYVGQIYQFGDYVVESISESANVWAPQSGRTEFRVKRSGADLEGAPVVARFSTSQVQTALQHGTNLVVFRSEQDAANPTGISTNVLVFDLSDPTKPKLAGSTRSPLSLYPYYPFFCGMGGGYWYRYGQSNWTTTSDALVFPQWTWDQGTNTSTPQLVTLNLADPTQPTVVTQALPGRANGSFSGVVPDGADPSGFFLTFQDNVREVKSGNTTFWRTRNYVQRFSRASATANWTGGASINVPGSLVRTWNQPSGGRVYLTSDYVNYAITDSTGAQTWRSDTRLNLLRASEAGGRAVAALTDSYRFQDRYVGDLVVEGNALFVNSNPTYSWYGFAAEAGIGRGGVATSSAAGGGTIDDSSDRLTVFDLTKQTFVRIYDQPTGTQGVQLMGTHKGHLFVNIQGDGVLAVDVANPARPQGRQFLRTLGWTTHLVFVGDDAYAAAGYFGVYRMNLKDGSTLPVLK